MNKGKKTRSAFVKAYGNGAKLLEFVEETLREMTFPALF